MLDELKEMNISARRFSQELSNYLCIEWTDALYQHINKVLKGEVEMSYEEQAAIDSWRMVQKNPHMIGAKYIRLTSMRTSVELLRKYMRSGIYGTTQTERIFSKILSLLD